MTKVIKIEQNGHVWTIPAEAVAQNRAEYYSATDPDTTYQEEYDCTISDDYELRDWFLNNMNFSDVANVASYIPAPQPVEPDLFDDETEVTVDEVSE